MRKFILFSGLLFSAVALPAMLPPPASSEYIKVTGDPVAEHHLLRLSEAHPQGSYHHYPYQPAIEPGIALLPSPTTMSMPPKLLTLRDAIALALRNNPSVEIAESQRILDKFGLELVMHNSGVIWQPLTASARLQNQLNPTWSAGTGIAVNAISGTGVTITHSNNLLGGLGSTKLGLTQHLLKGFGFAVNRVPYENAIDAEDSARLTFKNSVITVVVAVINNYRSLVESYNSLETNKQNFEAQEKSVEQTKLQVKVGQIPPSDLLQMQANLESAQLNAVQQEDALRTAYQTFLSSLGLVPSAKIQIVKKISIAGETVPSLSKCIALALAGNISYQQALLQFKQTKRALITAEDARKWSLDVAAGVTLGSQRSAVGQPIADLGTNPTLAFNLSVPIDNIQAKQGEVSAKIAIENAELQLEQQKEDLVRTIWDQWDNIRNLRQQIKIARLGIKLQEHTLENTRLKFKYGRAAVFEVNSLVNQLLQAKISLIGTEISYLSAVTTLYQALGLTLDRWNIKLRY